MSVLLGNHSDFIRGLMKDLGIDKDHVRSFALIARVNEPIVLEVEMYVDDEVGATETTRYRLTKEEIIKEQEE